jgi:phosphoglycerate kinase
LGSVSAARAIANLSLQGKIISVAGGGDVVASLKIAGLMESFTYVSTAGGAFLEWLEGRVLPGIAPLIDK